MLAPAYGFDDDRRARANTPAQGLLWVGMPTVTGVVLLALGCQSWLTMVGRPKD
jgi:hypothetical protein